MDGAREAYCVDILTQLSSIVCVSEKVALLLLKNHVEHCIRESIENGEGADKKIQELTSAVERFLRVQQYCAEERKPLWRKVLRSTGYR
jgi:CsoR family transcriptional regulator, copper-sensing transcriptional repressor